MVKEKSSSGGKQMPVTSISRLIALSSLLTGGFLFLITIFPQTDRHTMIRSGGSSATIHQSTSYTGPICNFTGERADNCEAEGDIRIHGSTSQVFIITDQINGQDVDNKQTWIVRPYTRKLDVKVMLFIREISLKLIGSGDAPRCQANHTVPAVIFSNRGFCGNFWHDFNDILVPLFITARRFDGEVQFFVTQKQNWWFAKYGDFFRGISKYDVIDLDNTDDVHCFPRAIVGLQSHKDLSIDPNKAPKGYSMQDFTKFLREVYSLQRNTATNLRENPLKKPRIYIIPRKNKRMLTNMNEIVPMVAELGFEVIVQERVEPVRDVAQVINSCDVMMGMHGSGLTNMVFLPTNAVLIQIIPLGKLDRLLHTEYGIPAIDMKLKYISYNITEEESTLLNMYPRDDPVFTNPMEIHKQGWEAAYNVYLKKQNVKLDVSRFRPVLQRAIKHLNGEPDS